MKAIEDQIKVLYAKRMHYVEAKDADATAQIDNAIGSFIEALAVSKSATVYPVDNSMSDDELSWISANRNRFEVGYASGFRDSMRILNDDPTEPITTYTGHL